MPFIKAIQARRDSRAAYARAEEGQGWNTTITPDSLSSSMHSPAFFWARRTLLAKLMPKDGKSLGEQVLIFRVLVWDANCPKYIPQRFDAVDIARALEQRDQRLAELETEVRRLLNPRAQHPSA